MFGYVKRKVSESYGDNDVGEMSRRRYHCRSMRGKKKTGRKCGNGERERKKKHKGGA